MNPTEIAFLPVHELCDAVADGRLTPVDIVGACLERIRRFDGTLHAYVSVYADAAMRSAEAATEALAAGRRIGPLHGVPVAVKDIIDIEGQVTTGGSAHWRQRVSPRTATLVKRLLDAGMIVLGKTHTVEFAMGGWGTNQHMGTPWNPWDLAVHRTPGGSSAGSGVAVAAGLAPWAIGTDTGGSVRLPSSWCGLTGLKTTVGRISTCGVLPLSPTLDTPGPMCRDVKDAATLLAVLQGADPGDPKSCRVPPCDPFARLEDGIEGMRLAVMPTVERNGVDPDVLAAFEASLEVLAELGAKVEVLDALPLTFADFMELAGRIIFPEGYAEVGALCEDRSLPLDEDVRPRILSGNSYTAPQYIEALQRRERVKAGFDTALAGFDALLTPGTASAAIPLASVDQSSTPAIFTRAFNLLDRCALVLPNGFTENGLPLSLQIVCAGFDEALALRIGRAFEQATGWHARHPVL